MYSPPRPYLSLSAEFHTEPLCSISPSILVPSIPGNSSSVSTEYCLLLPSRLRSRTAAWGRFKVFPDKINIFLVCLGWIPDRDAGSLNTFFTVAAKLVFLPRLRVTLAERIMGFSSGAILAST